MRVLLSALAVAATAAPAGLRSPHRADEGDKVAAWPEVRLRKLHIVRPDLIHYPLMHEVIC